MVLTSAGPSLLHEDGDVLADVQWRWCPKRTEREASLEDKRASMVPHHIIIHHHSSLV